MSDGIQSSHSESPHAVISIPIHYETPDQPPITSEDLAKLGVESRLIPFIVSATLWAEQPCSPPLSPPEAENLVEILDKVRLDPHPSRGPPGAKSHQSGRVIPRGESQLEE